jgi:hypothetical protein
VAVDLLVEMRATSAITRLRELAQQDARVVTAGIMDDIVRHDERLQARLRQAIQDLQAGRFQAEASRVVKRRPDARRGRRLGLVTCCGW